jgi:hypothetical protein
MSWTRTHEWWQALLEVVAEIEWRQDGVLPWEPRYAEIFGDRDGLRRALAYRWALIQQAHEDWPLDAALAARLRAVRLVLDTPVAPQLTSELVSA